MLRYCKNCGKEFEAKTARSEFDSNSCRVSYNRNNKSLPTEHVTERHSVTETPPSVTETVTETITTKHGTTETDKLFQKDAAARGLGSDWLAFSPIVRQSVCGACGKRFKTTLPLLSYCSPTCRKQDLYA